MGYEDNEQEIDLKEMFFNAIYRWRSLLLAGLILAVLLGAFKFWRTGKAAEDLQQAIADGTVVQDDFDKGYIKAQEKLREKETERREQSIRSTSIQSQINAAENRIADIQVSITDQQNAIAFNEGQIENTQLLLDDAQEYLDNSILMQTAEDRLLISRAYKVTLPQNTDELLRDPTDEVVASYRTPMEGEKKIAALQEKYGLTAVLMGELYSVGTDLNANTITITAYGKDEAMAKEIADAVYSSLRDQKLHMPTKHSMELVMEQSTRGKDQGLVDRKNSYRSTILGYGNSIRSYQNAIDSENAAITALRSEAENLNTQISDYQKEKKICDEQAYLLANEIAKMEEKMPSMIPDMVSRIKSTIKWAILGFVAGGALLFVIYVVIYVLKPMLRMPDDIRTVYGYPVLGVLNKKVREKVCAIDKWIMKAEGRGQRPGDDEIVKTAAVSIANTAEPGSLVAVMTTLKENNTITQIAEQLKGLVPEMQFVLLTEGISKASNVDELSRCDAAVLLEERNATSMGKLTADVNQIRLFNKKVLGAVVM